MNIAAPDLTKTPPRSGREMLGRYAWLARLADKVRADHAKTGGEYIAYCPFSMGFLERSGVSRADFAKLISDRASDAELVRTSTTTSTTHIAKRQIRTCSRT